MRSYAVNMFDPPFLHVPDPNVERARTLAIVDFPPRSATPSANELRTSRPEWRFDQFGRIHGKVGLGERLWRDAPDAALIAANRRISQRFDGTIGFHSAVGSCRARLLCDVL